MLPLIGECKMHIIRVYSKRGGLIVAISGMHAESVLKAAGYHENQEVYILY